MTMILWDLNIVTDFSIINQNTIIRNMEEEEVEPLQPFEVHVRILLDSPSLACVLTHTLSLSHSPISFS